MKKTAALFLALLLTVSLAACGGRSVDADALHARFAVLYRADFPQEYLDAPEENAAVIEAFGVEDFASTFADTSKFHCYNAEIQVQNGNDFSVSLLGLHVEPKDVGKGGVYINMLGDGVSVGMPANFTGDNAVYYQVLADASLSDEQVLQALADMQVKIRYVDASTGVETPEEAEAASSQILESTILVDQ